MDKEQVVSIILEGFIEDMKFIYSNAGVSEEEARKNLDQGLTSFSYISNNTSDRLLEKKIIVS